MTPGQAARHLDCLGVTWLAEAGYREPAGAWSGTVLDPDGNYVQVIELTDAYRVARRTRRLRAGGGALAAGTVATRLPAQDLERATRFHAEKPGLQPAETPPGSLRYQCGSGSFSLFQSTGRPSGERSQMGRQLPSRWRPQGCWNEPQRVRGLRTVRG